jgi:hypothetical protein
LHRRRKLGLDEGDNGLSRFLGLIGAQACFLLQQLRYFIHVEYSFLGQASRLEPKSLVEEENPPKEFSLGLNQRAELEL